MLELRAPVPAFLSPWKLTRTRELLIWKCLFSDPGASGGAAERVWTKEKEQTDGGKRAE